MNGDDEVKRGDENLPALPSARPSSESREARIGKPAVEVSTL
jgi:hypothetical protein